MGAFQQMELAEQPLCSLQKSAEGPVKSVRFGLSPIDGIDRSYRSLSPFSDGPDLLTGAARTRERVGGRPIDACVNVCLTNVYVHNKTLKYLSTSLSFD